MERILQNYVRCNVPMAKPAVITVILFNFCLSGMNIFFSLDYYDRPGQKAQ